MKVSGLGQTDLAMVETKNARQSSDHRMVEEIKQLAQKEADENMQVDYDELKESVDKMNIAFSLFNHNIKFNIITHNSTTLVQITDRNGDRVFYQIPPYKLFNIVSKLRDTMIGLVVDEKA